MNRFVILLTTAAVAVLGACAQGEVLVEIELEGEMAGTGAAEGTPLRDLAVRLLPYDRDAVFDSLEAAYPEPEPPIPADLLELQADVAELQDQWLAAQDRWSLVRDSLQRLSNRMEGMSRADAQYRVLFAQFSTLADEEAQLDAASKQAFEAFDSLQRDLASRSAELRIRRDQWAEDAFRDFGTVVATIQDELGREEIQDVTRADGTVHFRGVPAGRWWVVARFEMPYQELYWNIPIDVARGEPVQVRLSRENAELRPVL